MSLPQAAVPCLHARPVPHHQGGDGRLSVWFFRGVVGCLARIRLVFGVSSLIFHFKLLLWHDNPASYRVLAVSAFPPRGARPTTAFRGFMAARASNERAFAFGVSSDRSEGRGRHGPLADSYVCHRAFPSRVSPWCRK